MPRIRYLKPEFFSDEDLAELKYETRIAFSGLWCYADKAGRLEDRPKFLKAMIFPYDNVDMEKQLLSLACKKRNGKPFIQRYSVDGQALIQILNWEKHQKPHHTEKDSTFPPAPPLMEKGMGMGMEKQNEGNDELKNCSLTVKRTLKKEYGEFSNVFLTVDELLKLESKFGVDGAKERIEALSRYIASKGKKYASHYATVLSWEGKNNPGGTNGDGGTILDPVERIRQIRLRDEADRAAAADAGKTRDRVGIREDES